MRFTEGETPMTSALDALLSRVGQALESVTTALEREEQRADKAVARLESAEFRELAEAQPVLGRRSPHLKSAAQARLDRARAAQEAATTISDRVLEDLSSLRSAVLERSEVASALSGLSVSSEPGGGRTPGGRLTRRTGASTTENISARKAATKKSTSDRAATKKSASKKVATKKATTRKGTSKKAATKKSPTKKVATKKSTAKKTTGGRGARRQ